MSPDRDPLSETGSSEESGRPGLGTPGSDETAGGGGSSDRPDRPRRSDEGDRSGLADEPGVASPETAHRLESPNMLPAREVRRSGFERLLVRVVATCGVVGIGVAIAAILVSNKTQGWIVGLVVSIVSVVLSAVLWSSRQL